MTVPLAIVSGEASRTGSPRLLLSFLDWVVVAHPGTEVHLVLTDGGPLLDRFRRVAASATVLGTGTGRPGPAELLALAADELGQARLGRPLRAAAARRRLSTLPEPQAVLLNGAGAFRLLDALPWSAARTVGWVHELAVGLDRSLAGLDADALLRRPDQLLAVSAATEAELLRRGVDGGRIARAPGWTVDQPDTDDPRAWVRAQLGLPPGVPLVGGCGTPGWRKGTDLFLALAQRLDPQAHLVWIGDDPSTREALVREVSARGLAQRVHLVGEQVQAARWIAGLDVLALTSREDPFPLVALEASAAGVPVVAFASGGAQELLHEAGLDVLVSPYLDLTAFARAVSALLHSPADRARAGAALRDRVAAQHTVDASAPAVWEALVPPGA